MGNKQNTWSRQLQLALVREHTVDDAKKMMFDRLSNIPSLRGLSDDQIIDKLAQFLYRLLTGYYKDIPGLQQRIIPGLKESDCRKAILSVLSKNESAHHIIYGLTGDKWGEKFRPFRAFRRSMLLFFAPTPLAKYFVPSNRTFETLNTDYSLYGDDETLGQWIASLYGVMGSLMFGFLDAFKLDIIKEIDEAKGCHVFLDDLIGGVIAAAYAMLWTRHRSLDHGYETTYEQSEKLLESWIQSEGLSLKDLETIAFERQSAFYRDLPAELCQKYCEEGMRKVLSKSEIFELLEQVEQQRHNLTDPYKIEVFVLTYCSSLTPKYGTVGNTNIGVFANLLPAPLDRIEDPVLLYVVSAIVADVCGYVASRMESCRPSTAEVVKSIWANWFSRVRALIPRIGRGVPKIHQ